MLPDILPHDLDDLPTVIPVFPLPGPLLLPGTAVPLYAADLGLHNLIEDTWLGDRWVGVVQPLPARTADADGALYPGLFADPGAPLFTVGCLGHLGDLGDDGEEDQPVGLVAGVLRFRIVEELPPVRGYRRVRVDYGEFRGDVPQLKDGLAFEELRAIVRQRIEENMSAVDPAIMDRMEGTEIVTALTYAMPFSAVERQALMEAPSLQDLEDLLLTLMAGEGGRLRFDQPPLVAN